MKTKSIKILETTHSKFKIYCAKNNLKLNNFIDSVLNEYLEKINVDKKVSKSK